MEILHYVPLHTSYNDILLNTADRSVSVYTLYEVDNITYYVMNTDTFSPISVQQLFTYWFGDFFTSVAWMQPQLSK